MNRPPLTATPLADVFPLRRGLCYATCSPGQWDAVLQAAYDCGWVLLEVDDHERPVRAFRRAPQA